MCRFLLNYEPADSLVQEVMQVYLNTSGNIKSMIRTILQRDRLRVAPAKYKRPNHLLASLFRTVNLNVTTRFPAYQNKLEEAGQLPFNWPAPNGYNDKYGYWPSSILPRINFALYWFREANLLDTTSLATMDATTLTNSINTQFFAGEMDIEDKNEILLFLQGVRRINEKAVKEAFAMAFASPSFQWY